MRQSLPTPSRTSPATLRTFLVQQGSKLDIYEMLRSLIDAKYGDLPYPGTGQTLRRWQLLATVARVDLSLAKLYESHADALAILYELGHQDIFVDGTWGVWCAEPPSHRLQARACGVNGNSLRLQGSKAWCSGAGHIDRALVSAWTDDGQPCLAAVDLAQPEIRVTPETWSAVGMAATASSDVDFNDVQGYWVGVPGAYLTRPGLSHGAAGIAACWYGAASAIAEQVLLTVRHGCDDVHSLAHLGVIDLAITQARQQLRIAAAEIDAKPRDPCKRAVWRARLTVESAAETVLIRAPRAFGPGPMCKDAPIARLLADLPVFIRQSHAEHDLAAHGAALAEQPTEALWAL